MCGIAGFAWKDPTRPAASATVRAMTDVIAYRGPDDEGHCANGPVALGHRRLSIIDLSAAGHQPMWTHDGRAVIVFNGEIYNYLELRDELAALGHEFRTGSDTEVLLEAYREWGPACVERLNGMWAFVLHDLDKGELLLSRDRFGIKPLYYCDRPDSFSFASELKAILAALPDERRPALATIQHFMPSGALCDGEETFFENLRSLPPATNARYRVATGSLVLERYWDVEPEAFRARWLHGDPVETLAELLRSAVKLHMRSDVTVGTCLSGGVDSSTLVCLMSQIAERPVHTYSGLYPDRDCDESRYVDAVNRHARTLPRPVRPEPHGDLADDLATIHWHQDAPSAGPGLYTQYHVMKTACGEVKVILDGQGGDELFAGYIPYFARRLEDLVAAGIGGRIAALGLIFGIMRHWGLEHVGGGASFGRLLGPRLGRLAQRALRLGQRAVSEPTAPLFSQGFARAVGPRAIVRSFPQKLPSKLDDALYWHVVAQCLPALLHYEDRNSMAFSLEARVPLLDYRIVELAFALPPELKLKGTWTKWALRKAAEPVLPPEVAWRRSKLGYPTPFARWLRLASERPALDELLFSERARKREILNPEAIAQAWRQHQAGTADHAWLLWRAISLELWHRHFIDSFEPRPAVPSAAAARA